MTDYTLIKNDRIRTKICDLMSEMLDNPDEHGLYQTSRFMSKMEDFIIAEMTKPILDPKLVFKLVDDIFKSYHSDGEEYLLDTLIELGLMKKLYLTEEDIKNNTMPWIEEYDMEVGDLYYSYNLEEITEKLQAKPPAES